jgi:hypothetical protein
MALGRVVCYCKNRANGYTFLGGIDLARPNSADHFCPKCHTLYRHTVDEKGVITVKEIKEHELYNEILKVGL